MFSLNASNDVEAFDS